MRLETVMSTIESQLSLILRHPAYGFWTAQRLVLAGHVRMTPYWSLFGNPIPVKELADFLRCSGTKVRTALREIIADGEFREHMDAVLPMSKGHLGALPLLYVILRRLKPRVVVETGVASGISSAFMLLALHRNGRGRLISIDTPNFDDSWVGPMISELGHVPGRNFVDNSLPEGESSGWAVPESLRERWHLIIGDTKTELRPLIGEMDSIDLALHDSDHSFDAVFKEGSLLWERLCSGGLLLVDDIDISDGFEALSEELPWTERLVVDGLGMLKK